tara:strand:+ start:9511 stop:10536 length:1026 start_codon:yes stop_codon:yes gene_type:complete
MSSRLPVTIITGFLGSGKTTLLRHLLKTSKKRLAVIVNEFGSVGLDGDLLKTCGFCSENEIDGRLVELNNGCLCCTVQDDFLPTMDKLLSFSEKLDGIVIETSGLALPKPLLQALSWPQIRSSVYINGVVSLVDGQALDAGSLVGDISALEKQRKEDEMIDHITPLEELFSDQLSVADLVLISHLDTLSEISLVKIKNELSTKVQNNTQILPISNGKIDSSIILGLSHSELEFNQSDDHHHLNVISSTVRLEMNISKKELEKNLTLIAKKFQIIRLKGRCWLLGKTLPLQIQMVGSRFDSWFEKAPQESWRPKDCGLDLVVLSFLDGAADAIVSQCRNNSN